MTEAEWLSCDDPTRMLLFLEQHGAGSARNLRLFACACCRRIVPADDEMYLAMIRRVEDFARGQASEEELGEVAIKALDDLQSSGDPMCGAVFHAAHDGDEHEGAIAATNAAAEAADLSEPAERAAQAALVRSVFGNPFAGQERRQDAAPGTSSEGDAALT